MKNFTIFVNVRDEGPANKFFVFEDPTINKHIEIPFTKVPTANGDMGVQMDREFHYALIKLSGLSPACHYDFVFSDEAKALKEQVFIISEDIYGDNLSEASF